MIRNILKRSGSLLMVVLLLLGSLSPLPVYAAESLNTGISGLSASYTNGEWAVNGSSLIGSATGTAKSGCSDATSVTSTLTLTNAKSGPAVLAFNYTAPTKTQANGSVTIGGQTITAAGSYRDTLAAGASLSIVLYSGNAGAYTTSITLSDLTLVEDQQVTITFEPAVSGGSYTVDGTAVTASTVRTQSATTPYTLVATPQSGYKFMGWKSSTDGFISANASYEKMFEQAQTITAVFTRSTSPVFAVNREWFDDLNEAVVYAGTVNQSKITLVADGTLPAGSYTIPSGKTLLIPFDAAYTVYREEPDIIKSGASTPSAYKTLTMANGANLSVEGVLSISAKVNSTNTSYSGVTSGKFGQIKMAGGSTITVESGAYLFCWGYLTGSGEVTVQSGGTVYEPFQLCDLRGGTAMSSMEKNNKKVLPFSQYCIQNIEAPMTIEYGATENVVGSVTIQNSTATPQARFVGSTSALFTLASGSSLRKSYDPTTDRASYEVRGNAALNSISMNVYVSINTADYVLPLMENTTFLISSGTTTINQDVCMIPGCEVKIAPEASAKVASGKNLYVYDRDSWIGNGFVYSKSDLKSSYYSPTRKSANKFTADKMVDSQIDVNGTLEAAGNVFTTVGGADITSSAECGKVLFTAAPSASTTTYQATQEGTTVSYTSITATAPYLHNEVEDPAYTLTAGSAAGTYFSYCKVHHKWEQGDPHEGHEHTYGDPAWTWADDYSSASAAFTCTENDDTQTVDAVITSTTTDPTCETAGKTVYTATVTFAGKTYTDTKEVTIPAIGHDYELTSWTWATDNTSATAAFTCKNDASHVETVTAVITSETTEATCETAGKTVFTATVTFAGKTYTDTKEIAIPAIGHDYELTGWTWGADNTSATATFTCKNDASHIETVTAVVTSETTEATCEAAGKTVYTATATYAGKTYTDTKETEIPATGHDYKLTDWNWAADNTSATATFTCENDASHVETVTAAITSETTEATCEAAGKTVYIAKVTFEGKEYTDSKEVTLPALGHDYVIQWNWTEDFGTAKAVFTCQNDASHVISVDAVIVKQKVDPDCEHDGRKVFTAKVTGPDGKEYTDVQTVVIPALGHAYKLTGWTWAEDYSSATATFTCQNDAAHVQNVEATVTAKSEDATCTKPGVVTYTATVSFEDETYTDVQTVEGVALGHDYELTDWTWSEDKTSATATFTCQNDASHVETVTADVTSKTTAPTCEAEGKTVYTATVEFEGKTYTDEKEISIPATGHTYEFTRWTWAEDYSSAKAIFTCQNDAEHVKTVEAEVKAQTTEPTCETEGKAVYTATVEFEGKTYSDTKEAAIPALGHEYELTGWTWAGDYSSATATFTCKNDAEHVETITAVVTSEITKPTCETAGKTVYTATVEFEGKTYSDSKETTIPATGHAYELTGWTWTEDNSSATATFTCKNDAEHVETITAVVTSETTEPTCETAGKTVYTAAVEFEGKTYSDTKETAIPATGHAYELTGWTWAEDHSAAAATFTCENDPAHVQNVDAAIEAKSEGATCTEPGTVTYTATVVFEDETYTDTKTVEGTVLGHAYELTEWTWAEDYSAAVATFICQNDPTHVETVDAVITSETDAEGNTIYTATVVFEGETYTDTRTVAPVITEAELTRIYGKNRYTTSIAAADALKEMLQVDTFDNVIVAFGGDFPDALTGSYLAAQKHAPILLINEKNTPKQRVYDYIKTNLAADGTVYILGSETVVPADVEETLQGEGFTVKRLAGANRYGTNIAILEEVSIEEGAEVLVSVADNFADSLSASSTGKPIILVKDQIRKSQTEFFESLKAKNVKFTILGSEAVIDAELAEAIGSYGEVSRLAGDNRYLTSVEIAKAYFPEAKTAFITTGTDFPDGLCAGPLAYSKGAPVLLVRPGNNEIPAKEWIEELKPTEGYIMGGDNLLDDTVVRNVFGLDADAEIREITR